MMEAGVDPVWVWIARLTAALLFAAAGTSKLWHRADFREAIAAYELLPAVIIAPVALLLTAAELGGAAALLWPPAAWAGAGVLWLLLLVFSTAIAINLVRGRTDIDCGCWMFGSAQPSIGPSTLARNAVLALLIVVAVLPAGARPLSALDWLTIAMGTLAALGLFVIASQLAVNQQRLSALRTRSP